MGRQTFSANEQETLRNGSSFSAIPEAATGDKPVVKTSAIDRLRSLPGRLEQTVVVGTFDDATRVKTVQPIEIAFGEVQP